jgi:hypothetical protein
MPPGPKLSVFSSLSIPSLGDRVLAAAAPNGILQTDLDTACRSVRVNHVGLAISRHKKKVGRIEDRDGRLYATQSIETRRSLTAGTKKSRPAPRRSRPARGFANDAAVRYA